MSYSEDLIVKRVPMRIRERTKENMDKYCLTLYDAFQEAVRELAKKELNYTRHGTMMILENIFLVYIMKNIWILTNIL